MIKLEDRARRVAARLSASSDLDPTVLEAAAATVISANLPARDAIVIREAQRRISLRTEEAMGAWQGVRRGARECLPPSTFALWIEPLELVGAVEGQLVVTGPTRILGWAKRRYLPWLLGPIAEGLGYGLRMVERWERP